MGNLTRGNLLATIKSLKKHKRPKVVVANASVQAICGGSVPKIDKGVDLKSVIARRRIMLRRNKSVSPMVDVETFMEVFDEGFSAFCNDLKSKQAAKLTSIPMEPSIADSGD